MDSIAEPTVEQVCRRILASPLEVVEISEFACDLYRRATGSSAFIAAEWADRNHPSMLRWLETKRNRDQQRGVPPQYQLLRSGASEYVRLLDIPTSAGRKEPRSALAHASALLGELSDAEFECLGALLLDVYNAHGDPSTGAFKTPDGHDGGFDFGGWWRSGDRYRLGSEFDCRVAGQAKNWSSRLPRDQIELFAQRLEKLRYGHSDPAGFSRTWRRSTEKPILGLCTALSGFQQTCSAIARANWIVLVDGDQASADLVRCDIVTVNTSAQELKGILWGYL